MKKAFTLIEIIFVLIVIGILAAIGSEIVVKVYENYFISKKAVLAANKVEIALEEISNRLSHRIKFSAVASKTSNSDDIVSLQYNNPNYDILEWIGEAYEAFRGEYNSSLNFLQPGYSSFIDIENPNTDKTKVYTPGSYLSAAKNIIYSISGYDLSTPNNGIGLIFKSPPPLDSVVAFGWKGTTHPAVWTVYKGSEDNILYFDDTSSKRVYEQYSLAYTAYALVPVSNANGNYDLTLYYNFRPWMGEKYTDGEHQILISDVTVFQFKRPDRSIEIRLCAVSGSGTDFNVTICGKKVIF